MLEIVARYRLNEYSDVLGLLITVLGFLVTIWQVVKSRRISTKALEIANQVREELARFDMAGEISVAITVMEEIKRSHRRGEVDHLPDKYSHLRRSIISLRSNGVPLSEADQKVLQDAVSQLAASERYIERHLASADASKLDVPRMNSIMSAQIDGLYGLFVRLRGRIGE